MSTLAATNLKNASSGSNNIVLNTDGTTTVTSPSNIIKSGTAVASTSGTSIDFTSIPSWVKRVTVMFSGVSTNGTSNVQVQLGTAGGFQTTNYLGATSILTGVSAPANFSSGLLITGAMGAGVLLHGALTLAVVDAASGTWASTTITGRSDTNQLNVGGGTKTLSGTLDRVRITTVGGTDTFDAGTINILYEG